MARHAVLVTLLLAVVLCSSTGCRTYGEPIAIAAEDFINKLAAGRAAEAVEYFDHRMKEELSPAELEEAWEILTEKGGPFIEQRYREVIDFDFHRVVLITGVFERAKVEFRITFDEDEKIAGLYIKNPELVETYQFSRL